MKALSVKQPWAWLIIRPDITDEKLRALAYEHGCIKDVENRSRVSHFTGPCVIVASLKPEKKEVWAHLRETTGIDIPAELPTGVTIGTVTFGPAVIDSKSTWFIAGGYGYPLSDARSVAPIPVKGQLGFYELDPAVIKQLGL